MPPNLSPSKCSKWHEEHRSDTMPQNMKPHKREAWFHSHVPTSVELATSGNFGKPNHDQSFSSDVHL